MAEDLTSVQAKPYYHISGELHDMELCVSRWIIDRCFLFHCETVLAACLELFQIDKERYEAVSRFYFASRIWVSSNSHNLPLLNFVVTRAQAISWERV